MDLRVSLKREIVVHIYTMKLILNNRVNNKNSNGLFANMGTNVTLWNALEFMIRKTLIRFANI